MTSSRLDDYLSSQEDPEIREKVLNLVRTKGLTESDPVFLLMVANETVKAVVENTPAKITATIDDCLRRTRKDFDNYKEAALTGMEAEISKAVSQLVSDSLAKAQESKNVVTYKSLIGAGAMMLVVLLVGGMSGLGYARWIAQVDRRGLTADEIKILDLAQSKEGRQCLDRAASKTR